MNFLKIIKRILATLYVGGSNYINVSYGYKNFFFVLNCYYQREI